MEDIVIKILALAIVITIVEMQLSACKTRQKMGSWQFMRYQIVFTEVKMLHSYSWTNKLAS